MHILTIIIFLAIGYFLGKITCNAHFKKSGFWITLVLFAIINALHSFIDGTSLVGTPGNEGIWLMVGHEIIRQPMLYILFLGIIAPFTLSRTARFIAAIAVVTGVWALAASLGTVFGAELADIESLEPFIEYFKYLFIGDIIHHIVDWCIHRHKGSASSHSH